MELTIENPDKFRSNIRNKFNEILENEKYSINIEKAVHNWALKEATNRKVVKKWDNPYFVHIYVDHLRSIFVNLKNPKLLELIKSGELKAQKVPFMTHQEMCPEKWEELIQAKIKRDKNKFEQKIEASTDSFTCRKCWQKKCTFYQLQTRAADEPMTLYISCTICGNRWKC
jgi:transcription elongation factor S-II